MDQTRLYRDDEKPQVGDVIELFEGAYGAGVVTRVCDNHMVVERVHASASTLGQISIGVERLHIYDKGRVRVFVTGRSGEIDNRHRS